MSDLKSITVGLATPQDLNLVPGSGSARVMWSDRNTDESGFDVQWSNDGFNWSSEGTDPVNQNARGNHMITSLDPDTQYQVRVRATGGGATSDWSVALSVTTLDAGVPMKPTSVTASATTDPREATLTWDDDPEATGGFEVQIFDSYAQNWQDLGSAPAGSQSLRVGDLVSGNANTLRVVALGGLNGGASRALLASEDPGNPSSPSDPLDVETPYGDGLVTLWQPYYQHQNILSFDRSSADFSEDGEAPVQHSNDGFTLDLSNLPSHYGLAMYFDLYCTGSGTVTATVDGQDHAVAVSVGYNEIQFQQDTHSDSANVSVMGSGFDGGGWKSLLFDVNALRYRLGIQSESVRVEETKDVQVTAADEDGSPADGLVLSAADESGKVVTNGNATIGANGSGILSVTGVTSGTGRLTVKPLTGSDRGKTSPIQVVKVHLEQTTTGVDLIEGNKGDVFFRVADDNGKAVAGIQVTVGGYDNTVLDVIAVNGGLSDENGYVTFKIKGKKAGETNVVGHLASESVTVPVKVVKP